MRKKKLNGYRIEVQDSITYVLYVEAPNQEDAEEKALDIMNSCTDSELTMNFCEDSDTNYWEVSKVDPNDADVPFVTLETIKRQ